MTARLWVFPPITNILVILCFIFLPGVFGGNLVDDNAVIELAVRESDCDEDATEKDMLLCLYRVAQRWYHIDEIKGSHRKRDAISLYTYLANDNEVNSWKHVPSMVALGHYYAADGNDKDKAIKYFKMAADVGSNHSAMYNAGQLMAEHSKDYVGAIAYIHAAATLKNTEVYKNVVKENMLKVATDGYQILSGRIASLYSQLTLTQIADIFLYAKPLPSLSNDEKDTPSLEEEEEIEQLWTNALIAAVQIEAMYVNNKKSNIEDNLALFREVTTNLHTLWQRYSEKILSPLQEYLLLHLLNDTLAVNAGDKDKNYALVVARYGLALAMNQYCYERYDECFKPTASNAITSFQRSDNADSEEAIAMLELAQLHPSASISAKQDL